MLDAIPSRLAEPGKGMAPLRVAAPVSRVYPKGRPYSGPTGGRRARSCRRTRVYRARCSLGRNPRAGPGHAGALLRRPCVSPEGPRLVNCL